MNNQLYYGDNLEILRKYIQTAGVDLIYLDPPFNSHRSYNILFKEESGQDSQSLTAFDDTWHWDYVSENTYNDLIEHAQPQVSKMIGAFRNFLGTNQMLAYLVMMTVRLIELHRVLKPTGSLYLHCDPTASHYLKIVLDMIFGAENFRNEIVWKRSQNRAALSKINRRAHDVILFYSKSDNYIFHLQYRKLSTISRSLYRHQDEHGSYQAVPLLASGKSSGNRNGSTCQPWRGIDPNVRGKNGMHWITTHEKLEEYERAGKILWPQKKGGTPRLKYYLDESPGVPQNDIWDDISLIPSGGSEAMGYPTQKPTALLERIILASSNEGDVVLDPFAGCGTAIVAAEKLKRHWIGIDITHLAIALLKYRLKNSYDLTEEDYQVIGEPKSVADAE